MRLRDYFPGRMAIYNAMFQKGLRAKLSDHDALCQIPYGDNQMLLKPGSYESDCVGNLPGYVTPDGDRFIVDGVGEPVKYLGGVPVVLCIDPREHSAVLEPAKSMLWHKRELGEFVRVDREGRVVDVGDALAPAADEDDAITAGGAGAGGDPAVADGGAVVDERVQANQGVYDALYDVRPPRVVDEDSGEVIEEATGYVVRQSAAAEWLPDRWTNSEVKLQEEKAKNAVRDSAEIIKYIAYGAAGMLVTILVILGFLWLLSTLTSGAGVGISLPFGMLAALGGI